MGTRDSSGVGRVWRVPTTVGEVYPVFSPPSCRDSAVDTHSRGFHSGRTGGVTPRRFEGNWEVKVRASGHRDSSCLSVKVFHFDFWSLPLGVHGDRGVRSKVSHWDVWTRVPYEVFLFCTTCGRLPRTLTSSGAVC